MNDFTKEELNTLFHWGIDRVQAMGTECFEEEGADNLYEKLRVMIEDYCDHEKMDFMGDIFGFSCSKCDRIFNSMDIDDERQRRIINCEE